MTKPFDAASYLKTDADIIEYLAAALEGDDAKHIAGALIDIARAKDINLGDYLHDRAS